MTRMVEFPRFGMPVLPYIGKLEFVAYRFIFDRHGEKFWEFCPNGVEVDYGEGPKRLIAVGRTPDDAWLKINKNSTLLKKFGIEQ